MIRESTWEKNYKPIQNHLVQNAPRKGDMFETFGEELAFVKQQDPKKVWTWVDDEGDWIMSGYRPVNRIGYFITEVPWEGEDIIQVKIKGC